MKQVDFVDYVDIVVETLTKTADDLKITVGYIKKISAITIAALQAMRENDIEVLPDTGKRGLKDKMIASQIAQEVRRRLES